MKKIAVRNLKLCTKDCLCLYVCPYGATDTEDSIIDVNKCIGCGACAEACPSKAIYMIPLEFPPQQIKKEEVKSKLNKMIVNKAKEENIALSIATYTDNDTLYRLMKAIERSTRLINEDLTREAGYMLPQSNNTHQLLKDLIDNPPTKDFPKEIALKLLNDIPNNEKKIRKFKCLVCGKIFEVEDGENPVCPLCSADGDSLEEIFE